MQFQLEISKEFAALETKLRELPAKVAKKVVRQALREGAKIVQAEIAGTAKSMVGGEMGDEIVSNIDKIRTLKSKRGSYTLATQIKESDKLRHITAAGKKHFIPQAIEFGHINRDGKTYARAIPFMRTAKQRAAPRADKLMRNKLIDGIEREFNVKGTI